MPSIDGTAGRSTTSSGSAGDGIEGHDQRHAFIKEDGQEQPLLGLAKINRSQLADKAGQLNFPIAKSHTRGHSIRHIREHHMQQSTPVGSDNLGFGKHGANTYQEVLKLDPEYCRWADQVEDQQPHWKLKRFSSWLKMQSVPQEPNLENCMTRERLKRRIKELEEQKLFDNSTGGEKSGAEGARHFFHDRIVHSCMFSYAST